MSGDDAGDAGSAADAMLLMDVLRVQGERRALNLEDKDSWKAAKKAQEYVEAGRREAATDTSGC